MISSANHRRRDTRRAVMKSHNSRGRFTTGEQRLNPACILFRRTIAPQQAHASANQNPPSLKPNQKKKMEWNARDPI